jgi:hypothetical protein
MSAITTERFWSKIMECIQDREVIPIVGEELLWYPNAEGRPSGFLHDILAKKFAEDYLKPSNSLGSERLGSLFVLHPSFDGSGSQPYEDCKDLYKEMRPEIPESLRKLARIDRFQIFVSTTFDDLLERAINEVRYGGRPKTQVISYRLRRVPEESTIDAALRSGFLRAGIEHRSQAEKERTNRVLIQVPVFIPSRFPSGSPI